MKLIQSVHTRRALALMGILATAVGLTGCYVAPVNPYPVHVPVPVVPAVVPVTFAVRLYPSNDMAAAHGLVLLSCGIYGNVIRLLAPMTIPFEQLDEGMTKLEASLEEAAAELSVQ